MRARGEDLVGGLDPEVGLAGLVVNGDELLDRGNQLAHAAMHSATELLGGQRRKPSLDQVEMVGFARIEQRENG